MNIVVVGTGYVGLVSAVCLAAKGHRITCVDVNPHVVSKLNSGVPHVYERGLEPLLREALAARRFYASRDLATGLDTAELALIAVGTPSLNGAMDLRYVRQVARDIGTYLKTCDRHLSIVVKSTVVPGTTDTIVRQEIETTSGKAWPAFGLGMNPEFLREGEAIEDFMDPDRIVLGHEDARTLERLEALYAPWDRDKIRVNTRTAEMIKYANNVLLATQISVVNEIANLSAAVGAIDALDVMKGVHLDKRWNPVTVGGRVFPTILTYLVPGCGFGGSCFPKDVQALRSLGEQRGLKMIMLTAVLAVNDAQPDQVTAILKRTLGDLVGRRCLVLGLAFKPGTDDVRESPSLKIVRSLMDERAAVTAHDPVATENFKRSLGELAVQVVFVQDWRSRLGDTEIIIVATKWDEYKELASYDLAGKIVFDARRLLEPTALKGAVYLSIGYGRREQAAGTQKTQT
jgi:UDPglucose 6-dehydrogenase/GDP-mannose 6-dehydrogenase